MERIDIDFKEKAKELAFEIEKKAQESNNEAEFRTRISPLLEKFASEAKINLHLHEEYTLLNGRVDAVYNRLIIEYEPPGSLKKRNTYRANQHAISQVKRYIEGLVKRERHKPERVAGVVLDGYYFIFVRKKENIWYEEDPLKVDDFSTEYFLKLLFSLSQELALIPENLVRDFGENTIVSRKIVSALYKFLLSTTNPKVKTLFEQWSLQFSEVCDYEEASKLKVELFAQNFGITDRRVQPFPFFFCLHTYYATLIKLLALQIAQYYTISTVKTNLKQVATFESSELKNYLKEIEDGGIFKQLGISNFIEGDFFSWYLDIWNEEIYESFKTLISKLANYLLLTLDVDPDTTRDLLKKLYQQLMPKELRHNLGEYYTPDWLAERVLNTLGYNGKPEERLLDPACGSGTFLVLAIKRVREYTLKNLMRKEDVLEKILSNIVGFDLNPLAVISARTNYLLALGDLLSHRKGEISIPVYLCDSIMPTYEVGDVIARGNIVKFNTAVGQFTLPENVIRAQYIDILSNFLEEAVKLSLNRTDFENKLCHTLPLNQDQDSDEIEVIYKLYNTLLNLDRQGINGIWARIIKNAFAPLFVGKFDYIAGNPPWVNWENLPEQYRVATKRLWIVYGLFPHGGMDTILGKGKKDISMIMTYVSIDKYLKENGKLCFLITQSVFKSAGAGEGFRKFILPDKTPIRVLQVDDMVELKPFEGVANRTSIVVLQKGKPTEYPVPYNYWIKKVRRIGIKDDWKLEEITKIATYKEFYAEPVDEKNFTSAWITGRPKAIKAVKKGIGKSDYVAHEGVNTGGANGVYWVNIIDKRTDGLIIISNITEGGKKKIENIQTAIEPNLLYPLLRGRDVKKWKAEPSAYIIMVQDPLKRKGIDENEMKTRYPKTYLYLKRFENVLKERPAFKRYFTKKGENGRIVEMGPFYSMFDVGDYTFATYKVVWPRIASEIVSVVVSLKYGKSILPEDIVTLVACKSLEEAYYICSLMNSTFANFALQAYSMKGGKSFGAPHVLQNIRIPKFDPNNKLHLYLAELSQKAHEVAKMNNQHTLNQIEEEIDKVSAQIWGLTQEELNEIKISLKELVKNV
jgi:hypothetical protein